MYRDVRPVSRHQTTASTPETWARNFAASRKISGWRLRRYASWTEARIIRRFVPEGGRIADAGCGFGEWVAYLSSAGYRAMGVDYSTELTRRLRKTYPAHSWIRADIRSLPFASGSLDGVISWGVIEHDEAGPGSALRDFLRALKPGGHAIVTVPINSDAARASAEFLHRKPGSPHAFFQYLMSLDELRDEAARAGFEVVESGSIPRAHIAHIAPRMSARLPSLVYRIVNFVASRVLAWVRDYRVMIFAVLRKPLE